MDKLKRVLQLQYALKLVWRSGPGWCLCSGLAIFFQGLLPLASLYVLKKVIDAIVSAVEIQNDGNLSILFGYIALAAILAICSAVCRSLMVLVSENQSQAVADYVQERIQQKSVAMDVAFYETPDYQDTLHRAQIDARTRPLRIVNSLIRAAVNLLSLSGVAVLLFSFHRLIALLLFIGMIPGLAVALRMARRFFIWQNACTETERKTSYLHWMLTSPDYARECRSYGFGELFMPRFMQLRRQLRRERLELLMRRMTGELLAQLVGVAVLFGSLSYLALRTVQGIITVGSLVMFAQALRRAEDFFRELLHALALLYEDSLFLKNIRDFMTLEPQVCAPETPTPLPVRNRTGFRLDHIHFTYPGCGTPALYDVSMQIEPGRRVALVGHNGSGKTTLIHLLCRFYDPQSGRIDYNGTDIRLFPLEAYRKNIGVLFQNFNRYQFTVRENIQLGNLALDPSSERIERAAEMSGAEEMIRRFRNGFDTQLGRWFNNGTELSYGEWQKIAIARTFTSDGALLIFDEPSSFLDADAEEKLFATIRNLPAHQSILFVSHRFSTVRQADWIYVMDRGILKEEGTHEELLRLHGLYTRMFNLQARGYDHG